MTNNTGTLIIAPVRPQSTQDTFATSIANEIKGGHHQVEDVTARNAITSDRREEGMLCYTRTEAKMWRLVDGITNDDWQEVVGSGGGSTYTAGDGIDITSDVIKIDRHASSLLKFTSTQLDLRNSDIDHNQLANYNVAQHRVINDGSVTTTSLWSSQKIADELNLYIPLAQKAANNGVATLDAGGKVPVTQLPNSVMTLEGQWNASTNTPTLSDGTGNAGMVYEVTTPGTQNLGSGNITFKVGDWAVYGADGLWYKSLNSNEVTLVNGQAGIVTLDADDIDDTSTTNKFVTQAQIDAFHPAVTIGTGNGLSLSTQALSLGTASTSTTGALTSTDWNTFNNKEPALTKGNLSGTTNRVTVTGGTGAVIGSGVTLTIPNSAELHVAKLTNLTGNGYIKTSGSDGTLSIKSVLPLGTDSDISVSHPITLASGEFGGDTFTTIGLGYNTTNLKLTSNLLNTIQDIATTSSPTFAALTCGLILAPTNDGVLFKNLADQSIFRVGFNNTQATDFFGSANAFLSDDEGISGFKFWDSNFAVVAGINSTGSADFVGNISASSATFTNPLTVANGGTGQGTLTANKVMIGNGTSGVLTPSELDWDNTNKNLGIGITPSNAQLHLSKTLGVNASGQSIIHAIYNKTTADSLSGNLTNYGIRSVVTDSSNSTLSSSGNTRLLYGGFFSTTQSGNSAGASPHFRNTIGIYAEANDSSVETSGTLVRNLYGGYFTITSGASGGSIANFGVYSSIGAGVMGDATGVYTTVSRNSSNNYGLRAIVSGTSSNNYALHVSASSGTINNAIHVQAGNVFLATTSQLQFRATSSYINSPATDELAIYTASTERIRIDDAGNVGIGVDSPVLDFVLFRNTSSPVGARLQNTGSGNIYFSFLRTSIVDWNLGINTSASNAFQISSSAGLGTPRMTITTGGLVGVGGTPSSIFHTQQTNAAGGTKLIVHNPSTTNGSWSELDFSLASSTAENRGGKIQLVGDSISGGTYSMRFLASGGFSVPAERMRLFGPGGLAIGTTTLTSGTLLDVAGVIRSSTGFRTGANVGITDTFFFEDYYAQQCYIQTSGGIIIGMGFI